MRDHAQSAASSTSQPRGEATVPGHAIQRDAQRLAQLAHAVAPGLTAVVAGDERRLERAGDGQDVGHVGAPRAQQRLEARYGAHGARRRRLPGKAAALVAVAGHGRQQPGAVGEVEVDELARDAGRGGDASDRDVGRPALAHLLPRGLEDPRSGLVAGGHRPRV
jgi:hypothetical protein